MEYVMSDSQKPAELFRRSLDAFLAKDMRAWADLCAEDVLVEFPFAPAGTPSRLDGRVAIFEYLRNYPKIIDVHEIDSLEIYPTDRPDTVMTQHPVPILVTGRVHFAGRDDGVPVMPSDQPCVMSSQ
jgi:uncharacterized protein